MVRQIEKVIHNPNWHKKTISVNVASLDRDTIVNITCDYVRKTDGLRYLPDNYRMTAGQIRKYPTEKIKKATLHVIPIEELKKYASGSATEDSYDPQVSPSVNLKVADNWKAAETLELFKQKYLDALHSRLDKGWKYLNGGGYEKDCELKKVPADPVEKKVLEARLDELKFKHDRFEEVYLAMLAMVKRHEDLVTEMSGFYSKFNYNLFWKKLLEKSVFTKEQQTLLIDHFEFLKKYCSTLKIPNEEGSDNNES